MNNYLKKPASVQPRTNLPRFGGYSDGPSEIFTLSEKSYSNSKILQFEIRTQWTFESPTATCTMSFPWAWPLSRTQPLKNSSMDIRAEGGWAPRTALLLRVGILFRVGIILVAVTAVGDIRLLLLGECPRGLGVGLKQASHLVTYVPTYFTYLPTYL